MGKDRLASESAFHDRQASRRRVTFQVDPDALRFSDSAYLEHETWIMPAVLQLGELRGLRLLDFGCGHGMAAVVFARAGANVTAIDLSLGYLLEAWDRATSNGAVVDLCQATGEALPFADESFDRIWGNAILHHLEIRKAALELSRILKPGGVAVFSEPWGENRLLAWARQSHWYPGKARTPEEKPLAREDLQVLRQCFSHVDCRGFQFLGMARRARLPPLVIAGLDWCDHRLLRAIPSLNNYCRYVVLTLAK
jgi:SAM-dependent methyltransferase